MQQLGESNITNTPTDTPHLCSNGHLRRCKTSHRAEQGPVLNSSLSESHCDGNITSPGNFDAAPTPNGGRISMVSVAKSRRLSESVTVLNQRGNPLFGRRTTRYFDLRMLDGTKGYSSAKSKECTIIKRAKTLLIEKAVPSLRFQKPSLRALEVS
jgi:hypothetical protein